MSETAVETLIQGGNKWKVIAFKYSPLHLIQVWEWRVNNSERLGWPAAAVSSSLFNWCVSPGPWSEWWKILCSQGLIHVVSPPLRGRVQITLRWWCMTREVNCTAEVMAGKWLRSYGGPDGSCCIFRRGLAGYWLWLIWSWLKANLMKGRAPLQKAPLQKGSRGLIIARVHGRWGEFSLWNCMVRWQF